MVEGFSHEPGVHCGSVAMADLLRWAGVELSESMVFGLGSGLGFSYLKNDHMSPSRQIMGRSIELEQNAAEVLGLKMIEQRTSDPEKGWRGVREALEDGSPVIVQCDLGELPYWETETPFNGHRIVVAGYDEDTKKVQVADTHFKELQTIDRQTLQQARGSEEPPSMGNQYAWWRLEPAEPLPLEGAIREAIERNARQMRQGEKETGGLPDLAEFRDEITGWVDREDAVWSYRFAYECIEKRGTSGAMFRNLYREFLSEATEYLPELARFQMPVSMSRNADTWSTLATYLKAMALYLETDGEEPGEEPLHHVESMAEAVYQFESTFWQRIQQLSG